MDERDSKLEKQTSQEVFTKDGKWFMRFDAKTLGAEIPEDIGRIIKLALWSEERKQRSPNDRTRKFHANINCHQTSFAAVGLANERRERDYGYVLLPEDAFRSFDSPHEFSVYSQSVLGHRVGLVQIKRSAHSKEADHSFIAGFDNRERMVCFEKEGWVYPFRIVPVETIYNSHNYNRELWAVTPIDEVKESDFVPKIPLRGKADNEG